MNTWESTILEIVSSNNGVASLQFIYSKIPLHIDLTDQHLEIMFKAPQYHHQTRPHIDDLLDSGDLIGKARGQYSITEKGNRRLSGLK